MPNIGSPWKQEEIGALIEAWSQKPLDISRRQWAAKYSLVCGRSNEAIDSMLKRMELRGELKASRVPQSIYPIYNEPLEMTSEAVLVLPDVEAPFHHAEFLSRVLELAEAWNVKDCILAGDALHLDTFSSFSKSWIKAQNGNLDEPSEKILVEFAQTLGAKQQGRMMEMIGEMGKREETDGASTELKEAGKVLARLADQFENIDLILGNHEGRTLRVFETTLTPDTLLNLVHIPDEQRARWRVAPMYWSILHSGERKFQVEHPSTLGPGSAVNLCAQFHCDILHAHDHELSFQFDVSGKFYAIQMGHCVDEERLAYVSQRHRRRRAAHSLGAVIVRDGIPWLLHARSPFDKLRMI